MTEWFKIDVLQPSVGDLCWVYRPHNPVCLAFYFPGDGCHIFVGSFFDQDGGRLLDGVTQWTRYVAPEPPNDI